MGRLIDADALMKAMYHRAFETDGDTMWQSGCWVRYKAIEQVVKAQPTVRPEPQTWIPVSERLPDVNEDVLVTNFAGGMVNIEVDRCGQYDDTDERFWWYSQNPIAWMPLPKAYEVTE